MSNDSGKFHLQFERWARRVRARITLRHVLTGLAFGALLAAIACAGAWRLRHGTWRPWMAAAAGVGMVAGLIVAVRRRWSDAEVALFLDGRLASNETITTAVEMRNFAEDDDAARAVVVRQAADALSKGDPKRARPRVLRWEHVLIPASLAAFVAVLRLPVPVVAASPAPPGAAEVKVAEVEGLEKVIALGTIATPDPEQQARLKKIAAQAEKLKQKLREGMEERDAHSEIAQLRDAIAAERLSIGDGERRAGLEAAQGRLAEEKLLAGAAKALGDRDLTRFDEEMQKLASSREKADRDAAKKAIEEAAEAAKKAGAPDVARMLEQERKLFDERSKRGEALRELAKELGDGLSPEAKKDLEELDRGGMDKDSGKLAEHLADALGELTPEERKRLADKLKERAESGEMDPMAKDQLRDMAKKLETPEGQKQLEDMLKKMASEPPKSDDAERERALDDAERGMGEAEKQLGGVPMPMPGGPSSPGKDGPKGGDKGEPGSGGDKTNAGGNAENAPPGGPGSHHDTGRGAHKGESQKVEGDDFRARAGGKINAGAPMPGVVTGRGAGRAGDTANIRGTEGIGEVGPSEVGGVEHSDIPEEYREQVGRYFSP